MDQTQVQQTEQEVKLMFKLAKKITHFLSDAKKLIKKYLMKAERIKIRKHQAMIERQQKRKKEEIQKKRRDKMEERRIRIEKSKAQKQKQMEIQTAKKNAQDPPYKSIISIIRPEKPKQKQNKKQSKRQRLQQIVEGVQITQKQDRQEVAEKVEKEKPMEKPVEPLQPYYRFLMMKRNEIRSTTINMSMAEASKTLKNVWERLSDQEKRPYVQSYQIEKAKYERDMIAYYQPKKGKGGQSKRKDQPPEPTQPKHNPSNLDFIQNLAKM